MFYRLLVMSQPASGTGSLMPVPGVSTETRDQLVAEIDVMGSEAFTRRAIANLEANNPELFQMAHNFASRLVDYLHAMRLRGPMRRAAASFFQSYDAVVAPTT